MAKITLRVAMRVAGATNAISPFVPTRIITKFRTHKSDMANNTGRTWRASETEIRDEQLYGVKDVMAKVK